MSSMTECWIQMMAIPYWLFCIQKELCSNHFYMYIMCRPGLFQQVNILIKIVCKNWFRSTGLNVCVPVCTWGKKSCPKTAWSGEEAPHYTALARGTQGQAVPWRYLRRPLVLRILMFLRLISEIHEQLCTGEMQTLSESVCKLLFLKVKRFKKRGQLLYVVLIAVMP